ncbi:MAG: hypothetical protein M0Z47_03005 [Actinomycetota bacterium]|nr:hypothetical protein [Actinomycetota bacterium]
MSATLHLSREAFGVELRRSRFDVSVDGTSVGTIDQNSQIEAPIDPGHHSLQIRAGRYSSRAVLFDATEGEVVNYRCHSTTIWPRYLASILKPDLAISLRHE